MSSTFEQSQSRIYAAYLTRTSARRKSAVASAADRSSPRLVDTQAGPKEIGPDAPAERPGQDEKPEDETPASLKHQLQSKLQNARAGRGGDAPEDFRAIRDVVVGHSEVDVVEEIEELRQELRLQSLCYLGVLQ